MGFKHWESVRLSGHPVGQRKKMKKNAETVSHCFGDLSREDFTVGRGALSLTEAHPLLL